MPGNLRGVLPTHVLGNVQTDLVPNCLPPLSTMVWEALENPDLDNHPQMRGPLWKSRAKKSQYHWSETFWYGIHWRYQEKWLNFTCITSPRQHSSVSIPVISPAKESESSWVNTWHPQLCRMLPRGQFPSCSSRVVSPELHNWGWWATKRQKQQPGLGMYKRDMNPTIPITDHGEAHPRTTGIPCPWVPQVAHRHPQCSECFTHAPSPSPHDWLPMHTHIGTRNCGPKGDHRWVFGNILGKAKQRLPAPSVVCCRVTRGHMTESWRDAPHHYLSGKCEFKITMIYKLTPVR